MINKSIIKKLRIICVVTAVFAAFNFWLFNFYMADTFIDIAESNTYSTVQNILNDSVKTALTDCDYGSLTQTDYDEEGNVSMIRVNSGEVNSIALEAQNIAQEKLKSGTKEGIKIPIGTGISVYTAGKGPKITVNITPSGYVESGYKSQTESSGINQTRHKVFIVLQAKVLSVCGAASREYTIEESVMICDNIVVGKVPNSYVDVNDKEDMLNLIPEI